MAATNQYPDEHNPSELESALLEELSLNQETILRKIERLQSAEADHTHLIEDLVKQYARNSAQITDLRLGGSVDLTA